MIPLRKAVLSRLAALAEAPSKVSGITVTKVLSSRPALSVTWSEVIGSNITYNVCYSVEEGKPKVPPPGQSVCKAGITGPYFTLHPLSGGTTYYIWVRAESSGGQGPYSRRKKETTYNGTVFVAVYQYFTHVKCTVKLFECAGYHRAFSEVNCFRPLGESN